MSEYQPRPQGGWPAQPPADGAGQGGYGRSDSGYGPGSYEQATYGQQPAGRSGVRRRRRKRWPIVLTVLVVLILAILGIGDQVAKGIAQNAIAQKIESSGLSAKPSVNIEGWPFLTQLAAYSSALFFGCMVCHGETARTRPRPESLTTFYLCIAAGGTVGGLRQRGAGLLRALADAGRGGGRR